MGAGMNKPKIRMIQTNSDEGIQWPIEAKSIDDARRIWFENGVTMVRKMRREEAERLFPKRTSSAQREDTNEGR